MVISRASLDRNLDYVVDRRAHRAPEENVDGWRDRQPNRRRARRRQPQCRDRQGASPRPRAAPVSGEAGRGEGSEEAGVCCRAGRRSRRPKLRARQSRGRLAQLRLRRARRRAAPVPANCNIARSVPAGSSARVRASSRRRSHPRLRAGSSRPSRIQRSPTRPACSSSTTAFANGQSAIRASPISISAGSRRTPAFPIASNIAGSLIRLSSRAAIVGRRRRCRSAGRGFARH